MRTTIRASGRGLRGSAWALRDVLRPARARVSAEAPLSAEQRDWLGHIERDGFVLVGRHLADEACDRLRAAIDALLAEHADRVQRVSGGADERLLGADRVSRAFRAFWEDPLLRGAARAWCGNGLPTGFTMVNRIRATPGNLGSGNGWHRDRAGGRQFKAIVYLDDVGPDNGPFQYWRGSHRPGRKLYASLRLRRSLLATRFDDGRADAFFDARRDVATLTAPKGSLILADTTGIHRGRPLRRGVRHAMTNYYLEGEIPASWPVVEANAP